MWPQCSKGARESDRAKDRSTRRWVVVMCEKQGLAREGRSLYLFAHPRRFRGEQGVAEQQADPESASLTILKATLVRETAISGTHRSRTTGNELWRIPAILESQM